MLGAGTRWISRTVGGVLVLVTLIAAPLIDAFVMGSNHLIASLYGVRLLVAALQWRPPGVVVLSIAVMIAYTLVGFAQRNGVQL